MDSEHAGRVNNVACSAGFDIWLHGETQMLDAKSLLSVYAMVGQDVKVVVEDDVDKRVFNRVAKAMGCACA